MITIGARLLRRAPRAGTNPERLPRPSAATARGRLLTLLSTSLIESRAVGPGIRHSITRDRTTGSTIIASIAVRAAPAQAMRP